MIKKGRGLATVFYPTGFNGGGDPDMLTLHIKADGTIELSNASCEMGQGFKTVIIQMAAEALGVTEEIFTLDNTNSDTSAFSMDTAGSRSTYIAGLAAISAAGDLIKKLKEFASGMLETTVDKVEYKEGKVFIAGDESKSVGLADIGGATTYSGTCLIGCGGFLPPPGPPRDPETGATVPSRSMSFGSTIVDVAVDDKTGIVSIDGLYNCYDMGTVINPLLAEGQVDGGGIQGIGMGLYEDLQPYKHKSPDIYAANFTDYIIPTFNDLPKESKTEFYENYDPYGPYGAKGCGEMVTNTQAPAIINAIYDAVGVWVDDLPATPERILRLIDEKE